MSGLAKTVALIEASGLESGAYEGLELGIGKGKVETVGSVVFVLYFLERISEREICFSPPLCCVDRRI